MTERMEELITPKHNRLIQIANFASAMAWLVLLIQILQALGSIYFAAPGMDLQSLMTMFREYPPTLVSFLSNILSIFGLLLRGVVLWIILKGIALGLNMLVDTDLNYRVRYQGEQNE